MESDQHQQSTIYTCPMHPDVRSDTPGRCPKCGMELVPELEATATGHEIPAADDRGLGKLTWKNYFPLIVIIGLLLLVTGALIVKDVLDGTGSVSTAIEYFMIGFFLVFAGFKLIDLKGFVEGYAMYDLLARKWRGYGYLYPFIELGFGLAMLIGVMHDGIYIAEIAVMGFSGIGVVNKMRKKEQFQCVCLGTVLKVPLTTVTLVEDFGMAGLAAVLLVISG